MVGARNGREKKIQTKHKKMVSPTPLQAFKESRTQELNIKGKKKVTTFKLPAWTRKSKVYMPTTLPAVHIHPRGFYTLPHPPDPPRTKDL